jgi:putative glycosyltransferase (TIGR04372 family)
MNREFPFWRMVAWAIAPVTAAILVGRLLARFRKIRASEVVILMSDGGFAHTIMGPDVMRRLFVGRRCLFLCLSEYGRHNWRVAELWPDIEVVFLPLSLGITINRRPVLLPPLASLKRRFPLIVGRIVRAIGHRNVVLMSLLELYARLPVPGSVASVVAGLPDNFKTPLCYFKLRQESKRAALRLPDSWSQKVQAAVRRSLHPMVLPSQMRLCCLYLRQKGSKSTDATNSSRVGSTLESYFPAVELLNRTGYQVLLIGDISLDPSLYGRFGGMLIDAGNVGIDKELFNLYAATNADIFVGEAGGGFFVPMLNEIPSIFLNAFPYSFAVPNAWMYYKSVRDCRGDLVDCTKLFGDLAYDYELPGMTVHVNSAEEICEAVECFLSDVRGEGSSEEWEEWRKGLPQQTWLRHVDARISPAWAKRYAGRREMMVSSLQSER